MLFDPDAMPGKLLAVQCLLLKPATDAHINEGEFTSGTSCGQPGEPLAPCGVL